MSPLEHASIHYSQLSKAERHVCDQFLLQPEIVISKTITEIAESFHVSISAIQRFVKRIGYKGYSEFRYAMEESAKQDPRLQKQTEDSEYTVLLDAFSTALEVLKKHDLHQQLSNLAKLMKSKRSIRLCGIGNSSLPCKQLMYMLLVEGKEAVVYDNSVDLIILPEFIHEDDLAIFYTVSAQKSIYDTYVKSLKKKNVTCAIITMNQESDLLPLFDLSLIIPVSSYPINLNERQLYHIDNRSLMNIMTEIIMYYYRQTSI